MSDTVAVALITGVVGVVGSLLTWFAARRGAAVELERIKAENHRLRVQHSEDERRHRQGTYHNLLCALMRLDTMGIGLRPASQAEFAEWLEDYHSLSEGLLLFAPQSVCEALTETRRCLLAFGEVLGTSTAGEEHFRRTYQDHRHAIRGSMKSLVDAMRRDVSAHLADGESASSPPE